MLLIFSQYYHIRKQIMTTDAVFLKENFTDDATVSPQFRSVEGNVTKIPIVKDMYTMGNLAN